MSTFKRLALLSCIALITCLGCQGKDAKLKDDLKKFGLAYVTFDVETKKTPASWEELIAFAKSKPELFADSVERVRDAGYVVAWDAKAGPGGKGNTVLAKPPGDGPVVMMDGRMEEGS